GERRSSKRKNASTGHQGDAEPARDRVDERVGAGGIGASERVEVCRVDDDRRDDEGHRGRREAVLSELPEREWRDGDGGRDGGAPEEDDLVATALGQGVPARMQGGRADNQRESAEAQALRRLRARSKET